jgi:hypothetical protein
VGRDRIMAVARQRRRHSYSTDVVYDVTGNAVAIYGKRDFENMKDVMMECDDVGNRYRV